MNILGSNAFLLALRAALVAFTVNAFLAPLIFRWIKASNIKQKVSEHLGKSHQVKDGTPTMGGLLIFPGLLIALLMSKAYFPAILVLGFTFIGWVDDHLIPKKLPGKRGLGWTPKLILQFAVAMPVLWYYYFSQPSQFFHLPFDLSKIAFFLLSSIFIVAAVNAFNFTDGLDLLASGLLYIFALSLLFILLFTSHLTGHVFDSWFPQLAPTVILLGSMIPFMFYNYPPARIFMGDIGSLPLGALLGISVINALVSGFQFLAAPSVDGVSFHLEYASFFWSIAILCTIFFVELISVPIQVFSVKVFKKRLPIRTPIHHTFEKINWPEAKILRTFFFAQILLFMVALAMIYVPSLL